MDTILNFAKEYYLILLILGGIFLLALIGYFYDRFQNKDIKMDDKNDSEDTVLTESAMEETPVEQPVQAQVQQPVQQPIEPEQPVLANEQVEDQNN